MYRVPVVGVGALGDPCPYLVDGDAVKLNHLARQRWFGADDIGSNKAVALASYLA